MSVLASVLPNPGRVRLDIPGRGHGGVERRREKQRQSFLFANELGPRRFQGAMRPVPVGAATQGSPGLGKRIDPRFRASPMSQGGFHHRRSPECTNPRPRLPVRFARSALPAAEGIPCSRP